MTLHIVLENIGGIDKISLDFKKGKNLIKAPNATGKSSLVRGIELLNMPKEMIENRRYYLNLFATKGLVKMEEDGKKVCERIFIAKSASKMSVEGTPFHPEDQKANLFTLATPNNELIIAITTGRKLESLLTQYSDVRYYSFLISYIKSRLANLKKDLRIYLMYESDIDNMQQEHSQLEKELETARIEREILPEINMEEIQSYSEIESRYHKLSKEVLTLKNNIETTSDIIKLNMARNRDTKARIKSMEEEIKNFMIEHPSVDQEIARIADEIKEYRRYLEEVKNEKDETEKSIKEVRNWISLSQSMPDLRKCIVCGRIYTEKHAKIREDKLLVEDSHLSKHVRETEFQIDDAERRKEDLEVLIHKIKNDNQIRISKAKQEIRRLQKEMSERKNEIESSEQKYVQKESELKVLEESIDQGRADSIKLINELDAKIQRTLGKIEQLTKEIEEKSKRIDRIDQVQSEFDFYGELQAYLEEREKIVKLGVMANFNRQIKKVYQLMSYQDFEDIRIDQNFRLIVKRRKKGKLIDQPIESLSDSERITIALIVMLAGREEYLSDYPLFVLDKVTLDYDPTRFEMILDYLSLREVPYTLVTLAQSIDEGSGQLEVEYLGAKT
ncbi:MAG: archaea-specific SMC-related protein [Candidatus Hodarchaeales archaeon]|jgi:DNA repair exonuclease SbcCD ATPase subunit